MGFAGGRSRQTARVLRGHKGGIRAVALDPQGRWLVTGSDDNTARLWDLQAADPTQSARVLSGHEDEIRAVAIDPQGRWLVTGSDDKTARLWDLQAADPNQTVHGAARPRGCDKGRGMTRRAAGWSPAVRTDRPAVGLAGGGSQPDGPRAARPRGRDNGRGAGPAGPLAGHRQRGQDRPAVGFAGGGSQPDPRVLRGHKAG